MNNEQYNNMVYAEGFSNKDTNAVDIKIKENSASGKKNSIAYIFSILLILLGLAIIISYLGGTLLFFVWSISINNCSKNKDKNLFEYIFPTSCEDEGFCEKKQDNSESDGIQHAGGSSISDVKSTLNEYFKDIKKCIRDNKSIDNFCNTNIKSSEKTNWNNPDLYEWFLKSYKETDYFINYYLKEILKILPTENLCGITFAFAWFFYLVLLLLSIFIIPFLLSILFLYNNIIKNGLDYFMTKNKSDPIIKYIKLGVGIILTFVTFLIPGSMISISLLFKMLFYPLVIGASDIILKIINQNLFVIKIILILMSIVFVSLLSNNINKNIFNGILIGYLPLLLFNLWSMLN